ncbi:MULTISPECIES: hypothetical protein [Rheinheimera]|uniref:hypothetical protein n=1 Tax=Rheinheimera TaxID=67575 RepID=UPI00104F4CAE|nr:hypothetical protein [Rheinheimera sp. D18]QBL08160.1 hypothetical protein E0Z06_00845 [Rheinheimera sp. D18]
MRSSTLSADSSFMRELKRLLQALTSVADADSLVSLINDMHHFIRMTNNMPVSDAVIAKPELMPQLTFLAEKVLRLSEGNNQADTLVRSARLLGSLQLTAPDSPRRWRELQFGYKLLYRAALTLRLLEHALEHKLLTDNTLLHHYTARRFADDTCPFRVNVQLPLIIAVMLLDCGQLDIDAITLLTGYAGQYDANRSMQHQERQRYLATSKVAMARLLDEALQLVPYRGNSKREQQLHQLQQQNNIKFIKQLLSQSINSDGPLAPLLSLPQVYSSIVLPGRDRYQYEALPKASLLLKDGVNRGQFPANWVQQLINIVGIFPQGYGIAFIPTQHDSGYAEKYELAIVNQLYPAKLAEPLCRIVSRNLQYRRGGHNCQVSLAHNLYFKPARDRLSVIPTARLKEILMQLSADWEPGQIRRFLPRCWQPQQFFSQSTHQNLWNQAPNPITYAKTKY